MKVKCISLLNATGKPVESSPWLTIGKVYHVLSILRGENGDTSYQIVTNDRDGGIDSLGHHPAACFEIVSQFKPSNWRERVIKGSAIETSPVPWQREGFWEDLYDGDSQANLIFERERNLILSEEP